MTFFANLNSLIDDFNLANWNLYWMTFNLIELSHMEDF